MNDKINQMLNVRTNDEYWVPQEYHQALRVIEQKRKEIENKLSPELCKELFELMDSSDDAAGITAEMYYRVGVEDGQDQNEIAPSKETSYHLFDTAFLSEVYCHLLLLLGSLTEENEPSNADIFSSLRDITSKIQREMLDRPLPSKVVRPHE